MISTEDLADDQHKAGEVLFANVLLLPDGMSKVGVTM